jgi:hypothetical protein
MTHVEVRNTDRHPTYWLEGRRIRNGDPLLLRLRGNAGWEEVTVTGLPRSLQIRTTANDGKLVITSLPLQSELRWVHPADI